MILIIYSPYEQAVQFAQTLRGAQISQGKGALIVLDPNEGHELKYQIEKIIANGRHLPDKAKVEDIEWKPGTLILIPKELETVLDDIEKLVPGFKKHFGPIQQMGTDLP